MLPKKERLTTAAFNRSFSSGKRHHFPLCTIVVDAAPTFHGSVVVGKKVARLAVARNRLRRRVYGVLYRWSKRENRSGVFMVILKPAAATVGRQELNAAVLTALESLKS